MGDTRRKELRAILGYPIPKELLDEVYSFYSSVKDYDKDSLLKIALHLKYLLEWDIWYTTKG